MGRPKALLELDGIPLVAQHVTALASVCTRVAVVVGSDRDEVENAIPPLAKPVHNPHWATTHPSDSVRLAVEQLSIERALMVTPVDVLPAHPDTLRVLWDHSPPVVPVGPTGRRGHPVVLGPDQLARLRADSLPEGLRTLLAHAREVDVVDPFVEGDFDAPAAWRSARRAWVGRPPTKR